MVRPNQQSQDLLGVHVPSVIIEESRESLMTALRILIGAIPTENRGELVDSAQEQLYDFIDSI